MMVFFLDRCAFSAFLIGLFQGLVPGQRQVSQPPLQRPRRDVLQAPPELLDDDEHFFSDDGEAGLDGAWGDAGQGGAKAKIQTASTKTASAKTAKTIKTASTVKTASAAKTASTASVEGIFLFFPDLIQSNLFPNLTSYFLSVFS